MSPSPVPKNASLLPSSGRFASESLSSEASFTGPIPPPDYLALYEDVSPGLAHRLVQMAADEANHRREMETKLVESRCADSDAYHAETKRGQIFALFIVLAGFGASAYCMQAGFGWPGALLGATPVGLVAWMFITGRDAKPMPAPTEKAASSD